MWNLMPQPPSPLVVLFGFHGFLHGRGLDSSRGDTWYRWRRGQGEHDRKCNKVPGWALLQRRDASLLWTPWARFSCAFSLPFTYLRHIFSFIILLCLASSCSFLFAEEKSSATLQQVARALVSCVSCLISEFLCFITSLAFFVIIVPIYWWAYWLCSRTRYISSWFACLDLFAFFFVFLCLAVCEYIICTYLRWKLRADTGCTADVVG